MDKTSFDEYCVMIFNNIEIDFQNLENELFKTLETLETGVLKLWKPLENRGFKTLETLEMDFGK